MKSHSKELEESRLHVSREEIGDRLDAVIKIRRSLWILKSTAETWSEPFFGVSPLDKFTVEHLRRVHAILRDASLILYDLAVYFDSIKEVVGLDDKTLRNAKPDGAGVL